MFGSLPRSYVPITPNVMVFGGEAFERSFIHEGGALMIGISAVIKEIPEGSLVPSTI